MKNNYFALVMAIVMICTAFSVNAVSMVDVECATEYNMSLTQAQEEAELSATIPDNAILFEDYELLSTGNTGGTPVSVSYTTGDAVGARFDWAVIENHDGNNVWKKSDGYMCLASGMNLTTEGVYTVTFDVVVADGSEINITGGAFKFNDVVSGSGSVSRTIEIKGDKTVSAVEFNFTPTTVYFDNFMITYESKYPEGTILFEDYENLSSGNTGGTPVPVAYTVDGAIGARFDWAVITNYNGSKVWRKSDGYMCLASGMSLGQGTYTVSFDVFVEDGSTVNITGGIGFNESINGSGRVEKVFTVPEENNISAIEFNFTATTVYFDNFIIQTGDRTTAEVPTKQINVSFVDENGVAFEYNYSAIAESVNFVLPDAVTLGVSYTPEYMLGENIYFEGETVSVSEDTVFVVCKSNVIVFEDYERLSDGNTGGTAVSPRYVSEIGVGAKYDWASIITYNGTKVRQSTDGYMCLAFGMNLNEAGIYTVSYDMTVADGSTVTYVSNVGGGATVEAGAHIEKTFDVVEGESVTYYDISITSGATTVYFDNFKIEYVPFAPKNVNKASFRPASDGITAGIRYAAYVNEAQIDAATEYGFVITRAVMLSGDYSKLNLEGLTVKETGTTSGINNDNIRVVAGAAYIKDIKNLVYANNGDVFGADLRGVSDTFFTGLLCNIPENQRDDVLVGRPYIKIDGVYYYGDCYETSYNMVYNKYNS
jgi:methionine-rich copper-binding protein CopC